MNPRPITVISPRPLGEALLAFAAAKGIYVRELELLSFEYLPIPNLPDLLQAPGVPLVFTSKHAVQALEKALSEKGMNLGDRPCYAISGATAEALQNLGASIAGVAPNARQLAKKIAGDEPGRVFFFSGNITRPELLEVLNRRQVEVTEQVVYRKALHPVKVEEAYDAVLFFSGTQVDAFLQVNTLPSGIPAFCIGPTTAEHLSKKGHPLVFAAPEPLPTSLIHIVCHYFQK